jgi:hypothetical protein
MITWHVNAEGLHIYRGHEVLGVIPYAKFAILIFDLIAQMRKAI